VSWDDPSSMPAVPWLILGLVIDAIGVMAKNKTLTAIGKMTSNGE